MLGDAGKHLRPDLFAVMKSKHIVAQCRMVKLDMRTSLRNDAPAFLHERSKNDLRFGAGPVGQAEAGRIEIESGISRDFSTSSAMEYKANA